ncbi:MAG: Eco57I restriction-modification methylase domain-containing protein [Alphaproteobacteria bacterium]
MARELNRDPNIEWLDHVQPIGLVVAAGLLKELGLTPIRQTPIDTGAVKELLEPETAERALGDPWKFVESVLGWKADHVAGAPGGPAIPQELVVALPEHGTTLQPTWAVAELGEGGPRWQLLVRIEPAGVDPDSRGALEGWEATPHQRFERLLRDTGVFAGLLITDHALRLIYAPRGETSGHLTFPLRPLGAVAGRPMLGGLKLLLDGFRLFNDADGRRLPALLKKSRDAQAAVSTELAGQVLGALHELLRGLEAAQPTLIRELAATRAAHLYEGLLAVLMRLVFILYAEDRDLLPSRSDGRAREIYETGYSVRGLYAKLVEDAALNPDTMDERRGGWGSLLALFRLIHKGHRTHFIQARGGKLFDPDEFPFLEGRTAREEPPRILTVSDGCLLRILEGLMTLKLRGGERERLSYRTLDVEQIGSVYETVMGFTVEAASGRVLAIKAGKNNRTPVFVALDELLAKKGKDRIKALKENAGRSQLSTAQAKAIEAAGSVEALAAALDSIVDERASPRHGIAPAGTPILQPTGERRRTGSHYTPRSLTAPIVKYALEPAFERLGDNAAPDQILDLKLCDPAMGSGAFLVEACRAIGERLVKAWDRWPETRPVIPADEDEELHARRLVAQRCLYGVDKNPRAVDLARLSLWLATLARDHEFTFLDHALKCGDSLVGLTTAQIAATHWDTTMPPTFVGKLVSDHLRDAEQGRARIREQAEWATEAELRPQLKAVDAKLAVARLIGNGIVAAFFSADKPKKRIERLVEFQKTVQNHLGSSRWVDAVTPFAASLATGEHPIPPFHWQIEFPEVFARENGGFDAIVGNPPFAGKNTIIKGNVKNYLPWLQTLHEGAHGNADLVAHFFRRAFGLLRHGGVFGLIATNTIGQGDTRATGLAPILSNGGAITRATRRLKWPGEAAVVVSVVHIAKGAAPAPVLNGRSARRISAYLVEGNLDKSPGTLAANDGKAFIGSFILGMGFTFDDVAAAKGSASTLDEMHKLIRRDARNKKRIFPYIGGEEVNNDPKHAVTRYIIDFRTMSEHEARGWPDLMEIIESKVKPDRLKQGSIINPNRWWMHARSAADMYRAIAPLKRVLVRCLTSTQFQTFTFLDKGFVYDQSLIVFAFENYAPLSILCSRVHEAWALFLGATFKDDGRYNLVPGIIIR